MNSAIQTSSRRAMRFCGKLLVVSLCVCVAGFAAPTRAATPDVPVDQQPLTIAKPLPPNVVLMLDDSGSMNWDIMPDWDYLPAPNWDTLQSNWNHFDDDALLPLMDAGINGVYYSPDVTYTPPPKADGTSNYPDADFAAAHVNGFDTNSATVDLSTYRGRYDSNDVKYKGSSVAYSLPVAKTAGTQYDAGDCPSAVDGESSRYDGYCYYNDEPDATVRVDFFDTEANGGNGDFYVSRCNSKSDVYHFNGAKQADNGDDEDEEDSTDLIGDYCVPGISFFVYATGTNTGTSTTHYVSANAGDCTAAGLTVNCVDGNGTEAVATRQNIANWFSYYHTRLLMAKSGLMAAFSQIDPTFRFRLGFGSINGNNDTNLPSLSVSLNSTKIAEVQPFGDGSVGTQKANFWAWVAGGWGHSNTPLRQALEAVGMYYDTKDQPWQTSSTDTTMLACRQSYTILTTDGFWNGGSTAVGNQDGTDGEVIKKSLTYSPSPPFSDDNSNTLADVAMRYWKNDLTDLDNEVPLPRDNSIDNNIDPAFWQHMVTFTLGMGFKPVGITPAGTTVDDIFAWARGGDPIADFSWPTPSGSGGGDINNIADMVHAAVNGHGDFYSATDPKSFVDGIKNALKRAASGGGSGASLAANSTQLTDGTTTYLARYLAANWTGSLTASKVDSKSGKITGKTWSATVPAATSRNIYTYAPGESEEYVEFKDADKLSDAEKAALGSDLTNQTSMIAYLRGDASNAGTNPGDYRARKNGDGDIVVLGDIVHSQPVYVGPPDANLFTREQFAGSEKYSEFAIGTTTASAASKREDVIYVAANDGMLHAFDATTGAEVYAYLPAAVITHGAGASAGISQLADLDYGTTALPHQYFNDGQLTVADAYFDSGSGAAWHSVLVGTTGRGQAKAVYALDVTDPANIKFLWERSAWDGQTNSDYIGQMTGKPIIAQVGDGQWAVLIGNGYNSAKGEAALLQFDLSDGTLSVHQTNSTTGNGLATPGVWMAMPTSGISTIAYAGDLHGNLWSFPLASVNINKKGKVTGITSTPDSDGVRLFTAKIGTVEQPITSGILIGLDPATSNRWVFFGTGQYLSSSDIADTSVQSWYGLIVNAPDDASLAVSTNTTRAGLAERIIYAQFPGDPENGIRATRVITSSEDIAGKPGWYIDLKSPQMGADNKPTGGQTQEGERMVVTNIFHGSRLIGTSIIPDSNDLCSPSGTGWTTAIYPFTGLPSPEAYYDINGDGVIDGEDMLTVDGKTYAPAAIGHDSAPNGPIYVGGSQLTSHKNGTPGSNWTSGTGNNLQRVSWRELVNP